MSDLLARYRDAVAKGELKPDAAQGEAVLRLEALARALAQYRPGFFAKKPPRGLYIWGDVGRGKSMLMDLFFETAPVGRKQRVHFNSFMTEIHARIHALREEGAADPIPPAAAQTASRARLLCFDEFQVGDVADAMILGRLFDQLFEAGVVVVATSNTPPSRLYEGGLNRQLFLPFIAEMESRLDVLELKGAADYRLGRLAGLRAFVTPLGPAARAAMDAAWTRLTDLAPGAGRPVSLSVLGREVKVPQAARGVARFSFAALCEAPLAAADYLAVAREFHTVIIDDIPVLPVEARNAARRFTLLIDTLYDEGVKLVCSAAAPPDGIYVEGDGADSFRRTASRLAEMQSEDYLKRGHGIHG